MSNCGCQSRWVLIGNSLGRDCACPFFLKQDPEDLEHFWEIGYKGITVRQVCRVVEMSGWKLVRSWRVPEIDWHRFFLLKH